MHIHIIFLEQKIDEIQILMYLTDDEINSLTDHSIGDKIKLKRAIKALNTIEDNVSQDTYMPQNCILYYIIIWETFLRFSGY